MIVKEGGQKMSNKERIFELLDVIPDYKMGLFWRMFREWQPTRRQMNDFAKE